VSAIGKIQITKHKYQTNHNDRNSKSQTTRFWSHLRFDIVTWNLFGPILRSGVACNLLIPVYPD
jgi:hypothetical protein